MMTWTRTLGLITCAALLGTAVAHADEGRFSEGLTAAQFEKIRAYEMQRRYKVDHAKTLEDFLALATPEEIQDEFDIPNDDENLQDLVQDTADGVADVVIRVNLASQTVSMTSPLGSIGDKIASGRQGYRTERIARPTCYRPRAIERNHYSKKYHAPMPWSVFITGGYALHQGSLSIRSHGCVHLSAATAKKIYATVQAYGRNRTCILIQK